MLSDTLCLFALLPLLCLSALTLSPCRVHLSVRVHAYCSWRRLRLSSDISYAGVCALAARVRAAGAGLLLLGGRDGMLSSTKPVVAVTAVRTGCGKSQVCVSVCVCVSLWLFCVCGKGGQVCYMCFQDNWFSPHPPQTQRPVC